MSASLSRGLLLAGVPLLAVLLPPLPTSPSSCHSSRRASGGGGSLLEKNAEIYMLIFRKKNDSIPFQQLNPPHAALHPKYSFPTRTVFAPLLRQTLSPKSLTSSPLLHHPKERTRRRPDEQAGSTPRVAELVGAEGSNSDGRGGQTFTTAREMRYIG